MNKEMPSNNIKVIKEEEDGVYVSYEDFAELENIINENKKPSLIMKWNGKKVYRI